MKSKKKLIAIVVGVLLIVVLAVVGILAVTGKLSENLNPIKVVEKVTNKIEQIEKENKEVEEAKTKNVFKSERYWVLRGENGHFYKRTAKNPNLKSRLNKVMDYMKAVKKKGIKTAFVMVPPAVVEGVTKTPIKDYANEIADKVVSTMEKNNLKVMDVRDCFSEEEKRSQLFLKTDHHWTFETAFKVAGDTVRYLNDEMDLGVKNVKYISDLKNYKMTSYKDSFTGAFKDVMSKKILGVEDIEFIEPDYDTSYNYKAYDKKGNLGKETSGTFVEAFCEKDRVEETGKATFSMYMKSEFGECTYENVTSENDKKVLIIGTSHARPYSAFMSLYFKNTHYFSMQNTKLYVNLYDYIDEIKPDVVLVVFSVNSFNKEYMVNFKGADA